MILDLDPPILPTDAIWALRERPGLAWLDGTAGAHAGRYSYVGSDPCEIRSASLDGGDPLAPFDGLALPAEDDVRAGAAPSWIGVLAYDATFGIAGTTRRGTRHRRSGRVSWWGRYDAVLAHDHGTGRSWIVGDDAVACARLRDRLGGGRDGPGPVYVGTPVVPPAERHRTRIEEALRRIAAGDLYQVNLARRWTASIEGDPLSLFVAMKSASPVPLGMYLHTGGTAVLCRSMETFVSWTGPGTKLFTRPIKGTVARPGDDDARDAARLLGDAKEQAEHAMIVDLLRNDLGRFAATGTVDVEHAMTVEPYAELSHLVSTVSCLPREGTTARAVLEATFPPGSVTGAPKVAAVELIEELEPVPRGAYTGALGYVSRAGGLQLAVAIRTAEVEGGQVRYFAGGGIVEASDPDREVRETELKARVFLDAVHALGADRSTRRQQRTSSS